MGRTWSRLAPRKHSFTNRKCSSRIPLGSCRLVRLRWEEDCSASRALSHRCSERSANMTITVAMEDTWVARASACEQMLTLLTSTTVGTRRRPPFPALLVLAGMVEDAEREGTGTTVGGTSTAAPGITSEAARRGKETTEDTTDGGTQTPAGVMATSQDDRRESAPEPMTVTIARRIPMFPHGKDRSRIGTTRRPTSKVATLNTITEAATTTPEMP